MSNVPVLEIPPHIAGGVVVQATNLVKHFKSGDDNVPAVDGVTFSLEAGTMVALRGPSGCGKSTLLNLIGCLERPDSGSLIVDGIETGKLSGRAEANFRRRKVGFVFQQFNLLPQLTALENVMLPMEFTANRAPESRARERLKRVGLNGDRHSRRPSRLSGGEQQRVAIARALANDPPILIADEPTANLDSKTGRLIIELLHRQATEGRSVIIATHDAGIAARADLVLEMNDGQFAGLPKP